MLAGKAFTVRPLPRYLATLALASSRMGRHEEALKAIQRAIEMDQRNPSFRQTQARIKAASGRGE